MCYNFHMRKLLIFLILTTSLFGWDMLERLEELKRQDEKAVDTKLEQKRVEQRALDRQREQRDVERRLEQRRIEDRLRQ